MTARCMTNHACDTLAPPREIPPPTTDMQTLTEIRQLLAHAGLRPQRQFGQNFLVDQNLMAKMLEIADLDGTETVLEVGPGTGALTEELLPRAARVVAVEIDHGLAALLRERLGRATNLHLMETDVLARKHAISPDVLAAVGDAAHLVANLPYSIATPLIALCLQTSHAAATAESPTDAARPIPPAFERLTFTVQREVADRLAAAPGSKAYGPVSVVIALLGKITPGPNVPASAFWPRPAIDSRIVRIDFDPAAAADLSSATTLSRLLLQAFTQRRKQIRSLLRRKDLLWPPDALAAALDHAAIDLAARPDAITPHQFRLASNALV